MTEQFIFIGVPPFTADLSKPRVSLLLQEHPSYAKTEQTGGGFRVLYISQDTGKHAALDAAGPG